MKHTLLLIATLIIPEEGKSNTIIRATKKVQKEWLPIKGMWWMPYGYIVELIEYDEIKDEWRISFGDIVVNDVTPHVRMLKLNGWSIV
jgi:hypothetical protein